MLKLRLEQLDLIAAQRFFSRLRDFLLKRVRSDSLRQLVENEAVRWLWIEHWPLLRSVSEHDAAVYLTYVTARHAEGLDVQSTHSAPSLNGETAELHMKRFLSERGHLRFTDFDFGES